MVPFIRNLDATLAADKAELRILSQKILLLTKRTEQVSRDLTRRIHDMNVHGNLGKFGVGPQRSMPPRLRR